VYLKSLVASGVAKSDRGRQSQVDIKKSLSAGRLKSVTKQRTTGTCILNLAVLKAVQKRGLKDT
jgi:hypothetical protein